MVSVPMNTFEADGRLNSIFMSVLNGRLKLDGEFVFTAV